MILTADPTLASKVECNEKVSHGACGNNPQSVMERELADVGLAPLPAPRHAHASASEWNMRFENWLYGSPTFIRWMNAGLAPAVFLISAVIVVAAVIETRSLLTAHLWTSGAFPFDFLRDTLEGIVLFAVALLSFYVGYVLTSAPLRFVAGWFDSVKTDGSH